MNSFNGIHSFRLWAGLVLGMGLMLAGLSAQAAAVAPFEGSMRSGAGTSSALCIEKTGIKLAAPSLQRVAQVSFDAQVNCGDIERYRGFSNRSGLPDARRQNVDPDFGVCRFIAQDVDREPVGGLNESGEMSIQEAAPVRPTEALTF